MGAGMEKRLVLVRQGDVDDDWGRDIDEACAQCVAQMPGIVDIEVGED